ncbi:hypothetical protein OEV98_15225 [Caldibacillus lycopersici]|uniref:DUF2726 domain-containing protein n=1 Tax=Perspicuibacillus lycopersici TaxID=1325689 RepID=A0AAE3IZG2_9BACI|nr:hypothetical protein [Perspicuibacillus lycopersici]MCU9614895.1 hypothetical protein [Perspicuibacillus lycopersici]
MWTLDSASKEFEKLHLALLATEYKNTKEPMNYRCLKCGYEGKKSLSHLVHRKQGCKNCARIESGKARKISITKLSNIFETKYAELLSKQYHNREQLLTFKCMICGEIGERTYASVKNSKYACLLCGHKERVKNKTKYSLDQAKQEFFSLGLELLSDEYHSFHEEMDYQCLTCSYKGTKSLSVVKSKKGCPKCAGNLPLTFDEVNELFHEYDLKLKETVYVNARTPMKYSCLICGYEGTKTVSNLQAGKGCKGCSTIENSNKQRLPYDVVKSIIEARGWTLVSKEYVSNQEKLHLLCDKKHPVFMNLNNFRNGKGCAKCSGMESPTFEQRKAEFLKLNLDLLDASYKNTNSPLKYKCLECGYIGEKSWKSAKNGYGCLACSPSSVGEKMIAEWLLQKKIKHIRQYRINECRNNKPLPFDFAVFDSQNHLFCLIEFDGEQHFNARDFFGGKEAFLKRQENDQIKNTFCRENKIKLIRISYLEQNQINRILEQQCRTLLKDII